MIFLNQSLPHSLEHRVTPSLPSASWTPPGDWLWVIDWQLGRLRSERVPTRMTWFVGVAGTVWAEAHCDWLIDWSRGAVTSKLSEKNRSRVCPDQSQKRMWINMKLVVFITDLSMIKNLLSNMKASHTFQSSCKCWCEVFFYCKHIHTAFTR